MKFCMFLFFIFLPELSLPLLNDFTLPLIFSPDLAKNMHICKHKAVGRGIWESFQATHKINLSLSLSPFSKEEFSLHQKLWDSLYYRDKFDKSDTKHFANSRVTRFRSQVSSNKTFFKVINEAELSSKGFLIAAFKAQQKIKGKKWKNIF